MPRTSRQRQRGAETVEFVATLPFILMLFVLFVDAGIAIVDKALLNEASRAAALEVSRGGSPEAAWAAADAVLKSAILWTSSEAYSCDNDATKCPITSDGLNSGDGISVTVTLPYQWRSLPRFLATTDAITISSRTEMRRLRDY